MEFVAQSVGDGIAVFPHQHEAESQHDFALAVGRHDATTHFVRDYNVGNVADANRDPIDGGDDNPPDLFHVDRAANTVNQDGVARLANGSTTHVQVIR